jgi:hypothetical protein
MDSGVSLADIAAVTDKTNGMFGGADGGMWIFALLILLMIGGGGFFGGTRNLNGEPVTEAGLCNAMNFNNLENSVGRLNDNVQHNYQGLQNGLCNLGYETLRNFNATQTQLAECCCTTQRAIDALAQNKIDTLQAQVNQLQLQSAMCGVVRYPNATTYTAGFSPVFNSGCGCSNI